MYKKKKKDPSANQVLNSIAPVNIARRHSANRGVAFQMLSHGNVFPLGVVLGTITHLPESVHHVGVDVMTADLHSAPRRRLLGDDDFHGCGLAGTVVTQQAQNLARVYRKREISHGDLPLLLRGLFLALRAAAAGRSYLPMPILLPQILHSCIL